MKKWVSLLLVCLAVISMAGCGNNDTAPDESDIAYNGAQLTNKIISEFEGYSSFIIYMNHFAPFEWDQMIAFAPGTDLATIHQAVGYEWEGITESAPEGTLQVVFLKSGQVVCYLYGTPSELKFDMQITIPDGQSYIVIPCDDNAEFEGVGTSTGATKVVITYPVVD